MAVQGLYRKEGTGRREIIYLVVQRSVVCLTVLNTITQGQLLHLSCSPLYPQLLEEHSAQQVLNKHLLTD
jgi:hypothetical protein